MGVSRQHVDGFDLFSGDLKVEDFVGSVGKNHPVRINMKYFAELFRVYISDEDMKYSRYTEYLYIDNIVNNYMEKHNGN